MKNVAAVGFCALITAGASAGVIDDLRLDSSPFSYASGGEFTVTPLAAFCGLSGLPADLSPVTFQTFCVEAGENFAPGGIYECVINTDAVEGGMGVGGSDPLDARSAYLYTYFRMGALFGYDYGAGRQASAGELQQAFWFIEGEAGGVNNAFVAQADAAVAVGGVWEGVGLGNVRVLNLWNDQFPKAQDQLTMIPAPATGLVLALGLGAMRRRR